MVCESTRGRGGRTGPGRCGALSGPARPRTSGGLASRVSFLGFALVWTPSPNSKRDGLPKPGRPRVVLVPVSTPTTAMSVIKIGYVPEHFSSPLLILAAKDSSIELVPCPSEYLRLRRLSPSLSVDRRRLTDPRPPSSRLVQVVLARLHRGSSLVRLTLRSP